MTHPLADYYRCPDRLGVLGAADPLPSTAGFFRFGGAVCYGRQAVGPPSSRPDGGLVEVSRALSAADGTVVLPFDLSEVVTNLRHERYVASLPFRRLRASRVAHLAYYLVRPILPVGVRKHLQRLRLKGWRQIAFPRWPVDVTVETVMKRAARSVLEQSGARTFPFTWFWPDGAAGCVMVTHDVEGPPGARRAGELMDIDERFGIKSSFQLVPEAKTSRTLLAQCRRRGFEVNVHDFNHDGHLFRDKALFDQRVKAINRHAREWDCGGFRAGAMYRRPEWFSSLDFAFDMSIPSVAHLEPQQGGCCTVMPYFIGNLLELPLTTAQDYSLFHILGEYSTDLWKEQTRLILANHGLVSFIVHPDYLVGPRELDVYADLLSHLAQLRDERKVWVAFPSEIDRWWRQRREMRPVRDGGSWRIAGPGAERARVAYARLDGKRLVYEVAPGAAAGTAPAVLPFLPAAGSPAVH